MEKTLHDAEDSKILSLLELAATCQDSLDGILQNIDVQRQTLAEGVSPREFSVQCANLASRAMLLVDYLNQLPVTRPGLIEAINEHLS